MSDDIYDINKYTDKELYDILDMNNPTDRELEAKIIHLMNKYDNMQNDSGDKLSLFFQNIYTHFFNDDNDENTKEGFENPMPSTDTEDNNVMKQKNGTMMSKQLTTTVQNNEINTNKIMGQDITSVQQFDYSADHTNLNPILKQTIKRIISIDSQYRNIRTNPMTTSFSFDLSEPLKDVVSLKLYSVQIPYTWYTIPQSYGSNYFYLKGSTTGINDGNHDYKIAIPPGNYTSKELETTINQRFRDISNNSPVEMLAYDMVGLQSASDVNFNSKDIISYDANTCKMTMNLDLQKVYTESYYQILFPTNNIPTYLGFNDNVYDACSITSNKSFTTTIINNTSSNRDYALDSSNNYFTVNVHGDNANNITYSHKVILQKKQQSTGIYSDYIGEASRGEIFAALNETLQMYNINSKKIFETNSLIEKVDQENGNSCFKLTIILNRYSVKYNPNMNVKIVFPNEISNPSNYRIWTYSSDANHNCFFFDNQEYDISEIMSERNSTYSNYVIDSSTNILLTCKKTNYTKNAEAGELIGENDIIINIPTTNAITLSGFMDSITQSFNDYNSSTDILTFNTTSIDGELKGAYIDPVTSKFNLTIDLEKKFTTQYYNIKWGNNSLLSGKNRDGTFNTYNVGDAWNANKDLSSNITENIFTHRMKSISSGYYVDASYIFTITPTNNTSGNKNAPPLNVTLSQMSGVDTYIFTSFSDYISAINDSIYKTTVDEQYVLAGSKITYSYNQATQIYDLSLNIVYNYSLTERNYDVSFIDYTYDITQTRNIWNIFDISSNYALSSNLSENEAYAIIKGRSSISGDLLHIIDGSNTIVLQTNAMSQYSIPNDKIILTIPTGNYTNYTLCTEINRQIALNPKLFGSIISQFTQNAKIYTKIKMKINNIYTSKDYNIVFYDPISFAKCYNGSRSVQTTTWDSTLGWILGFRDYTQYTLISENLITENDKKYYLTSITGNYNYTETKNNNNLIINVNIKLVGDTTVSTNLYNYFLISLDDFIQNHLNDGLVTITRKETSISTSNSYKTVPTCDPVTNTAIRSTEEPQTNITKNQLYSLNQSIYSQRNPVKTYSPGPFIKDLFGLIPIKVPSKNGDYYIEFGGSLQSQERLYFGPVNIRKMSIQLLNDRGDLVDLNNTNWSFSFICEQLYKDTTKT